MIMEDLGASRSEVSLPGPRHEGLAAASQVGQTVLRIHLAHQQPQTLQLHITCISLSPQPVRTSQLRLRRRRPVGDLGLGRRCVVRHRARLVSVSCAFSLVRLRFSAAGISSGPTGLLQQWRGYVHWENGPAGAHMTLKAHTLVLADGADGISTALLSYASVALPSMLADRITTAPLFT